jgi:hypothetical protein
MANAVCTRCRYIHPLGQICPKQLFQVRLGLKDSGKSFGSIIIKYNTTNEELKEALNDCYRRRIHAWTRSTRMYSISGELYTVSGDVRLNIFQIAEALVERFKCYL